MRRKILSFLAAFAMVFGIIASPFTSSKAAEVEEDGSPSKIKVNVHKILMSKEALDKHQSDKNYDPTKGVGSITEFFGGSAKEIDKVYFVAIKEGEDGYSDFDQKSNEEKDSIIEKLANNRKGETTSTGLSLELDNPGNYNIYEVKHKSTYKGEDEKTLAEQKAVPVELKLPEHAETPTGVANEINVYPKNTEDGPNVTKAIIKDGEDLELASFDKTKEFNWAVEADIPTGFKDYSMFKISDTLEDSLSYVKNQDVKVSIKDSNTQLEKDTDYTLTEPTEDKGGELIFSLTKEGINKLANSDETKKIRLEFTTTINKDAIMSKNIPNKADLNYGINPDDPLKKESNAPEVYTGGKRFKKIDSSKDNKELQGAKFVVKNSEGNFLYEEDGNYSWKKPENIDSKSLSEEENIKILESDSDGIFEITGLEYKRDEGTEYEIVEIQAPDGYALKKEVTKFDVNDTSYYKDAKIESPETAEPQNVDNKPLTIPQTGGIGSLIFIVVGIALMGIAIAMKRRNSYEDA